MSQNTVSLLFNSNYQKTNHYHIYLANSGLIVQGNGCCLIKPKAQTNIDIGFIFNILFSLLYQLYHNLNLPEVTGKKCFLFFSYLASNNRPKFRGLTKYINLPMKPFSNLILSLSGIQNCFKI